jgi:predicted nucleic acid-binding protein
VTGPTAVIDTNIFLSAKNPDEPGYTSCRKLLDRIDRGDVLALISTVTVAEIRAGMSPEDAAANWRALLTHLLTSPNYRVEPVDVDVAEVAGSLRAASRLTLPDAIVVATGQLRGATCVVTQDDRMIAHKGALRISRPRELL